jgi:hypothetical protein
MVRLGHKRSLARKSAFDAILLVILASFLALDQRHRSSLCHNRRGLCHRAAQSSACVNRLFILVGLAFSSKVDRKSPWKMGI